MVYQIVYVSTSPEPLTTSQISDILNSSSGNNARDGITGLLMYHDQLFFQVLEGERSAVESCYSRIGLDGRHSSLALMWKGEDAGRTFPNWAMGYAIPDKLGPQGKDSLQSLAKLKNGKGSTLTGNTVAAELARWIIRDFKDVQ
tara:strand:+ start:1387 stop:1818 length:432 start_codon:yes stop_codon:yes gene_type:complete